MVVSSGRVGNWLRWAAVFGHIGDAGESIGEPTGE